MDGVLADFDSEPNAKERYETENLFFYKLKPLPLVKVLSKMLENQDLAKRIYILTASPNILADLDKIAWLYKHLPKIKAQHIITVRNGNDKARYATGNLLIDDYTNNLIHWELYDGIGVKYLNGRNGKKNVWNGIKINEKTLDKLIALL